MKRKVILIIFIVLTILWIAFIHSNSLDNGAESDAKSSFVTTVVNELASAVGIKQEIPHSTVRTLAHFGEFAILCVLICADILIALLPLFLSSPLKLCLGAASAVGISFIVACVDELLQRFSSGRAAELSDVLTDTAGAFVGAVFFVGIFLLTVQIFKKSLYRDRKL